MNEYAKEKKMVVKKESLSSTIKRRHLKITSNNRIDKNKINQIIAIRRIEVNIMPLLLFFYILLYQLIGF